MYITLFGILIPLYGLMIVTGVCIGAAAGIYLVKKNHLSTDDFILGAAYTAIGGFVGAKLLYLWVSRDLIQWGRIFEFEYFRLLMTGGFVFYGGLAGGLTGLWLSGRIHRISVKDYLYVCIPLLPFIHGFGRIGCGLVGCCYGIPYNGPMAIQYTESAAAPLNVPLFPVQYLEAGINILLAILLFFRVRKTGVDVRNLLLYLITYSALRFALEFLRFDKHERGVYGGISTSQWISAAVLLVSAVLFVYDKRNQKILQEGKEA